MADTFTRFGKQILRDGKNLAQAADEDAAEMILAGMTTCPLQSFNRAQAIGEHLWNRWHLMTGKEPPFTIDDMAWADIVQFIVRMARDPEPRVRRYQDEPAPEGERATYNEGDRSE